MSNVYLFSSSTTDYPWLEGWRASLREHCNVPWEIFNLDEFPSVMPHKIVQHGEWLDLAPPNLEPEDVVLFVDADCVMQRPFTQQELDFFKGMGFGEMAGYYNMGPFYGLYNEGWTLAKPRSNAALVKAYQLLKDKKDEATFNGGFLAARVDTWKVHRQFFEKYWPIINDAWEHYGKMQILISYVMHRHLIARPLPSTVTTHGMMDFMPSEVNFNGTTVEVNRVPVAVRHALFLEPRKDIKMPENAKQAPWPEGAVRPIPPEQRRLVQCPLASPAPTGSQQT